MSCLVVLVAIVIVNKQKLGIGRDLVICMLSGLPNVVVVVGTCLCGLVENIFRPSVGCGF